MRARSRNLAAVARRAIPPIEPRLSRDQIDCFTVVGASKETACDLLGNLLLQLRCATALRVRNEHLLKKSCKKATRTSSISLEATAQLEISPP